MTIVRRTLAAPLFLLALAAPACNDRRVELPQDPRPAPADAPPALTLAHEAYLAGNYVEMGEHLRDTIADPHTGELARDNAFALLESAYEATHGHLPARTALPPSVVNITLGVMNGALPFGPHRLVFLNMRVVEGRAAHVKDMRVTRLPNEPILALADKRGALRVTRDPKGFEEVAIDVRQLEVLPDRGAFAIQIVFDDAPGIDTFVLANKLVASAQPEVTSPEVGQVFKDPHPEIAWHPYRSPELASWEQPSLYMSISRDSTKESAWNFYKWEPGDLGSVRVGDPGTPSATLEPDSYWLDIMCQEERTFGAIRISRATNRARPFTVVR
ncbi:MAG: hypothetical protein ACXVEF_07360 [Polyangiales bacterium]